MSVQKVPPIVGDSQPFNKVTCVNIMEYVHEWPHKAITHTRTTTTRGHTLTYYTLVPSFVEPSDTTRVCGVSFNKATADATILRRREFSFCEPPGRSFDTTAQKRTGPVPSTDMEVTFTQTDPGEQYVEKHKAEIWQFMLRTREKRPDWFKTSISDL